MSDPECPLGVCGRPAPAAAADDGLTGPSPAEGSGLRRSKVSKIDNRCDPVWAVGRWGATLCVAGSEEPELDSEPMARDDATREAGRIAVRAKWCLMARLPAKRDARGRLAHGRAYWAGRSILRASEAVERWAVAEGRGSELEAESCRELEEWL
jgi:hypothetical protein